MREISVLIKRNIKVFLRDKTSVFFSFLSVLIMLALYFLFLRKLYEQGLEDLPQNLRIFLTTSQMMGGILIISTLSLALGMMGNLVSDMEYHQLEGFLVTPVKRYKIITSYYISSFFVTFILNLMMFLLTFIIVGLMSGYYYSFVTILEAIIVIFTSSLISSSLLIFLTVLLKSMNAFSTLAGILGTFVGFVSGVYMPLSVMGNAMKYIASILPYTHLALKLKQVLLHQPLMAVEKQLINDPNKNAIIDSIRESYGVNDVGLFGLNINTNLLILIFFIVSFAFLYFAFKRMTKRLSNF